MKRLMMAAVSCSLLFAGCKKDDSADARSKPSGIEKVWNATRFDEDDMTGTKVMTLEFSNERNGAGNAHLDLTFDGTYHYIEDDTYKLSPDNQKISFTKTGGDFSLLQDGGEWTINTLNTESLQLTSAYNLKIIFK